MRSLIVIGRRSICFWSIAFLSGRLFSVVVHARIANSVVCREPIPDEQHDGCSSDHTNKVCKPRIARS
jgi:hypothetical protein